MTGSITAATLISKALLDAPTCYTRGMRIPDWLHRRLANAFPSLFLQPDEPLGGADLAAIFAKHCTPVVHHSHIVINFTGPPDDFPAFREMLLKTLEDAAKSAPGDPS